MINITRVKEFLKKYEGFSSTQYQDTTNNPTIGYGHLNYEELSYISKVQAEYLLEADIQEANRKAKLLFTQIDSYPIQIQEFLILMTFNIGYRLRTFRKANYYLKQRDYERAYKEYKDSLWYNQIGKTRANETLELLRI